MADRTGIGPSVSKGIMARVAPNRQLSRITRLRWLGTARWTVRLGAWNSHDFDRPVRSFLTEHRDCACFNARRVPVRAVWMDPVRNLLDCAGRTCRLDPRFQPRRRRISSAHCSYHAVIHSDDFYRSGVIEWPLPASRPRSTSRSSSSSC